MAGTLLALASAACWSLANVAIQGAARRFGTWGALVWAQLLGGAGVALVAWGVEGVPKLGREALVPLAIAALSAGAAYIGLFEALRRGKVAVVTPVVSAWSLISVAIGVLRFGAPITAFGGAGVALVVGGNALLARSSGSSREQASPPAALGWAALGMIGFGTMVPAFDRLGHHVGRLWAVPLVWALELALLLPVLALSEMLSGMLAGRFASPPDAARWPRSARDGWIAARAALFEAGGFVAISLALGLAPVTVVTPVSSLSTAGSVLLGLLVLRERLPRVAVWGALAASAGVVLVNI